MYQPRPGAAKTQLPRYDITTGAIRRPCRVRRLRPCRAEALRIGRCRYEIGVSTPPTRSWQARSEMEPADLAHIATAIRKLVDDYRERCLWFVRRDYYPIPATRCSRCSILRRRELDGVLRDRLLTSQRGTRELRGRVVLDREEGVRRVRVRVLRATLGIDDGKTVARIGVGALAGVGQIVSLQVSFWSHVPQ